MLNEKIDKFLKVTFFASLAYLMVEIVDTKSAYAQSLVRAPMWGDLCLDIANPEGRGPQNGAPVLAWQCHGGGNQIFQVARDGTIRAPHWGGFCLDIADPEGRGPQNGAPVLAWQCHGGGSQQWSWQRYFRR